MNKLERGNSIKWGFILQIDETSFTEKCGSLKGIGGVKMDYIREAIERLKYLRTLERAKENLRDTILELRVKEDKGSVLDGMPKGKKINYDDVVVNNLFRLQQAEERYKETVTELKKINKELDGLKDDDRELLTLWFVEKVDRLDLCSRFNISNSELYRRKDRAIREFAVHLFGIRVIK